MPAIALPVALALGALADLVAALVGRLTRGERRPWRSVTGLGSDVRRLLAHTGREKRVDIAEAGGGLAALVGGSLAAGAAVGFLPGSAALVYLALAAAAAGGHVAASASTRGTAGRRALWARRQAAAAEPAFVAALGAAFLRWRAFDIEAVLSTQSVLGPGVAVGRGATVAGLLLAGGVLVVAGALRMAPAQERSGLGRREPPGSSATVTLARWSVAGATALVTAALLAGYDPGIDSVRAALVLGAGAVAAAVALGLVQGILRSVPDGPVRLAAGGGALLAAAGANWLVVLR